MTDLIGETDKRWEEDRHCLVVLCRIYGRDAVAEALHEERYLRLRQVPEGLRHPVLKSMIQRIVLRELLQP